MKRAIGGFFEIDIRKQGKPFHQNAHLLSTGRSCIGAVLDKVKPIKVYVPDYNCYAVFQPMLERDIKIEPYFIDEQLDPINLPSPRENELLIYVNYFGLKNQKSKELALKLGERVLIDDTHRFFHHGYPGSFSFTSARKYFGVPDGAYLFSDFKLDQNIPKNTNITIDHNVLRFCGEQNKAFKIFQKHEANLDGEVRRASLISEVLLSNLDYDQIADRRRENFNHLHNELKPYNILKIDPSQIEVPFCYPLMPRNPIDKGNFYQRSIFVPNYWPDVLDRDISSTMARNFSENLLPLPIDQRYGKDEMNYIIKTIKEFGKPV